MPSPRCLLQGIAALTLALSLLPSAQAAGPSNGDFSNGLSGWSTTGDVDARTTPLFGLPWNGPTLLLGTASTAFEDDSPFAAGAYNLSGQSAVEAGTANGLEVAIGLAAGALDHAADGHFALEGSAAWQSFAVQAGDTLAFDWNMFTREPTGAPLPDTAWLFIDSRAMSGAVTTDRLAYLGNASFADLPAAPGWRETGLQQRSHVFATSGMVTLGWAVGDVNDFNGTSVLSVQHVSMTPVPEPTSIMLALVGLAMMLYIALRQR